MTELLYILRMNEIEYSLLLAQNLDEFSIFSAVEINMFMFKIVPKGRKKEGSANSWNVIKFAFTSNHFSASKFPFQFSLERVKLDFNRLIISISICKYEEMGTTHVDSLLVYVRLCIY